MLVSPLIQAQDAAKMRADFLKLILSDSQMLTDQYERALAKLESDLAADADYEQAQLVQRRREELRAIYPGGTTLTSPAIPLAPERARLVGTAEARGDTLTNWRTATSQAEWAAVHVTPGSYYLELEASMSALPSTAGRMVPQEKATFAFYEVSLLPGAQENRRSFDIMPGKDETYAPLRIGPLNFSRDAVTLRLAPAMGYPANAISLRQFRLVPAVVDVVQTAASLPEGDALAATRELLQRELVKVQKPVLTAYKESLKTLPSTTPEMKEAVEAETKRLTQLENYASTPSIILERMIRQLGGVAGFEDIDGARYLSTVTSTGDRFTVEHDGRQIAIRLMWVSCAPPDEKSMARKNFADHFDIEMDNVGRLSRTAREFTLGYLDGKSLRLLLRPMKDKDGFQPALVFLPEVGLYQNVLVDQGLAAVEPFPKNARAGLMERGLYTTVLEHEAGAKRLKNGAWALSEEDKK
ncbi:hypothetical protein BGE01nite_15570 [Brevifollis gellanilyticus]|uniref:TNase-like domain-containing protein n=2 Tax=Brevifollis gellanilyticus TaxID=748831 RepID=A0A512M694_9BACT|nr:hypothetical protein BGE01nite_15570 [Brevifollis gellanilyticus]